MIGILLDNLNPDKLAHPQRLVGREQAAYEFRKAMMRYLPAGSLAAFTSERSVEPFRNALARYAANEPGHFNSVALLPAQHLPQLIASHRI